MRAAVDRCELDLAGRTVLTEAGSGPYLVTPVLAAMAGAEVLALARSTRYATGGELQAATSDLAARAGVAGRVRLVRAKTPDVLSAADIVTNSGQVRPIDADMVGLLKRSAVIPLMYEAWEYRAGDVDLAACRARNIPVAGTNESHPWVDALAFVGVMAVRQLHDAGVAVYGSRIVLLCDNAFGPCIAAALGNCGADVAQARRLSPKLLAAPCDAVLLAVRPGRRPALTAAEARLLAQRVPGAVLVQFWGDVDRDDLAAAGLPAWPPDPPAAGHMGVLPSAVGPEPVIRLQSGGLKVGELLARGLEHATPQQRDLVQTVSAR
jgi:hypothetical protein